jgi:hypothetical protein
MLRMSCAGPQTPRSGLLPLPHMPGVQENSPACWIEPHERQAAGPAATTMAAGHVSAPKHC